MSGNSIFRPEAAALADRVGEGLRAAGRKVFVRYQADAVAAAKRAGQGLVDEAVKGEHLAEGRGALVAVDKACGGIFTNALGLLAAELKSKSVPPSSRPR